jgi:hypothetical protein
MLINGFILGGITFIGWAFAFSQMPPSVRAWFSRHNFITDAIVIFATYTVFGSQLISFFAAAWVGLFFESMTYIMRNEQDFDWMFDLIKSAKMQIHDLKNQLREMNKNYQTSKEKKLMATISNGQNTEAGAPIPA